jgi:hypothetical protein
MSEIIKSACKDLEGLLESMATARIKRDLNEGLTNNPLDMKDQLAFCIEHIKMPLIAPASYQRAYLLEPAKSIELMGQYLESTLKLNKNDRLYPIKSFMEQEWAEKIFKDMFDVFIEKVIPVVLKNGLLDEMSECNINIVATSVEGDKDNYIVMTKFKSSKKFDVKNDELNDNDKKQLVIKSEDRRINNMGMETSLFIINLAKITC